MSCSSGASSSINEEWAWVHHQESAHRRSAPAGGRENDECCDLVPWPRAPFPLSCPDYNVDLSRKGLGIRVANPGSHVSVLICFLGKRREPKCREKEFERGWRSAHRMNRRLNGDGPPTGINADQKRDAEDTSDCAHYKRSYTPTLFSMRRRLEPGLEFRRGGGPCTRYGRCRRTFRGIGRGVPLS